MTHIDAHQAWCHDCGTNQYLVSAYYVRVHRSSLLLFLIFNRSKGEKCPQNDAYTVEDCTLDSIHSIHQSLDLKLTEKQAKIWWRNDLKSISILKLLSIFKATTAPIFSKRHKLQSITSFPSKIFSNHRCSFRMHLQYEQQWQFL